VVVGISGGVDSAVSALLLKKQGFDVVGVHLYCWPPKSEIEKEGMTREEWIKKNGCRADEDRAAALKTALELGIPFKVLDFSEEYNRKVISYFYDEYEKGRTPNPDVLCNSEIKFGLFLDWAIENGFDYVATGHYAKLTCDNLCLPTTSILENGNVVLPAQNATCCTAENPVITQEPCFSALRNLSKIDDGLRHCCHQSANPVSKGVGYGFDNYFHLNIPRDKHKDQTYFLWKLTQKELARVLFPLGDLTKTEVREIANQAGLSVAQRKDSQGICFVGNVDVKEFLARRLKDNPGVVVNEKGEMLGKHNGVWHYTIGERGGWEMDSEAQKKYVTKYRTPIFYVVSKDAKSNILTVSEAGEATQDNFEVGEVNIISNTKWKMDDIRVRIRHGGELIGARVEFIDIDSRLREYPRGNDSVDKSKIRSIFVVLDKPMRGVASGQSAVFYSNEGEMLGGGAIR